MAYWHNIRRNERGTWSKLISFMEKRNGGGADLRRADLSDANLSGCTGILRASDYIEANFEFWLMGAW